MIARHYLYHARIISDPLTLPHCLRTAAIRECDVYASVQVPYFRECKLILALSLAHMESEQEEGVPTSPVPLGYMEVCSDAGVGAVIPQS